MHKFAVLIIQTFAEVEDSFAVLQAKTVAVGATAVVNNGSKINPDTKSSLLAVGGHLQLHQFKGSSLEESTHQLEEVTTTVINSGSKIDPDTKSSLKDMLNTLVSTHEVAIKDAHDHTQKHVSFKVGLFSNCTNSFTTDSGLDTSKYSGSAGKVVVAEGSHRDCRQHLSKLHQNKTRACDGLAAAINNLASPDCAKPGRAGIPNYLDSLQLFINDNKQALADLEFACATLESQTETKIADCKTEQTALEDAFCGWRAQVHDTCGIYGKCYADSRTAYQQIVEDAKEDETLHKMEWKLVAKLKCYLNVLVSDDTNDKRTEAMEACKSLSPDDSHLILKVPDIPDISACDYTNVAEHPCTGNYKNTQYSGMEFIADCQECSPLPDHEYEVPKTGFIGKVWCAEAWVVGTKHNTCGRASSGEYHCMGSAKANFELHMNHLNGEGTTSSQNNTWLGMDTYLWSRNTATPSSLLGVIQDPVPTGSRTTWQPDYGPQLMKSGESAEDIKWLQGGLNHACAAHSDGRVFCWGRNDYAQCNVPAAANHLDKIRKVTFGDTATCVLMKDNTIECFGKQAWTLPDYPVKDIALSSSALCYVKVDDSVNCLYGPSGASDEDPIAAGKVESLVGSSGGTFCAVKKDEDRAVICWNYEPQTAASRPSVQQTNVKHLASVADHFCVVSQDNRIKCWGGNFGAIWEFPEGFSFQSFENLACAHRS